MNKIKNIIYRYILLALCILNLKFVLEKTVKYGCIMIRKTWLRAVLHAATAYTLPPSTG